MSEIHNPDVMQMGRATPALCDAHHIDRIFLTGVLAVLLASIFSPLGSLDEGMTRGSTTPPA